MRSVRGNWRVSFGLLTLACLALQGNTSCGTYGGGFGCCDNSPTGPPEHVFHLSGTVRDADSRGWIAGARIDFDADDGGHVTLKTDTWGRFSWVRLGGASPGHLRLKATASGYRAQAVEVDFGTQLGASRVANFDLHRRARE